MQDHRWGRTPNLFALVERVYLTDYSQCSQSKWSPIKKKQQGPPQICLDGLNVNTGKSLESCVSYQSCHVS